MGDAERYARIRAAVEQLYAENRQTGHAAWCGYDYDFVCPSTGTYPFQWLWDSCFHAVVLSCFDHQRAASEVRSLMRNQSADGLISHVTFWQRDRYEEMLATYAIAYRTPHLSDCMQPPVLAEAIDAVARRSPPEFAQAFLREVLPGARRFFDWLDRVRDPDRDGLVATLQPDESGLDHAPKYDAYMGVTEQTVDAMTAGWERVVGKSSKPTEWTAALAAGRDTAAAFAADRFICEDVLVNVIYAENQRLLGELCARIGDGEGAREMKARADKTAQALLAKCWDGAHGLFYDLAGQREQMLRVNTVSSLMPLLLPELSGDKLEALIEQVRDPKKYAAPYPLPTTAMDEPLFSAKPVEAKLVWRGTTWINTNWYVARGLRRHGQEALARHIEDQSAALLEQSGIREHYNPLDAEGYGAHGFSWSGLVLDMLHARI